MRKSGATKGVDNQIDRSNCYMPEMQRQETQQKAMTRIPSVPFDPPSFTDRPFGCPIREWRTPSEAYQHGFRDGFLGEHDMPAGFHALYELGLISGMVERRARAGVGALKATTGTGVAPSPSKRAIGLS